MASYKWGFVEDSTQTIKYVKQQKETETEKSKKKQNAIFGKKKQQKSRQWA